MGSGLYFTISALFIIVLVYIMFFFKKHQNTSETRLYSWLIVTNFIGVIIEFACTFASMIKDTYPILSNIILKLYLVYIITWATIFAIYIHTISRDKNDTNKEHNVFLIIVKIIYYLSILALFILPIELVVENSFAVRYTRGPAVDYTYGLSTVIIVYMLYTMIKNYKKLKSRKYIPLFVFLVIGAVCMYFQMLNPSLLLMTAIETYIVLLMYFTIENPDLKILRELEFQKVQVENSKNISNKVINTISDNLSESINKISSFGHKKFNYNNIEEVKSEVTSMQKFALEYIDNLDSLMELSKTQSEGFEIVNTKYEPLQVLDEIEDVLTVKNNNINIIINKISDIPPVVYGDPVKIKQILLHLYNGILKISNLKDINLDISYLTVGSLCRFKVCTEIYLNDLINEYTKELKNNTIDFEVIDRIVKMIDGKFNIILKDNAVKIEILINQKYVDGYYVVEEVNTLNKKINYMNLSNKNILIVDDDKNRIDKLMNILSNYNCNIAVSTDYDSTIKECNDKVFDLIIIDDIISDIDRIKNYLLIDNSNGLLKVMDHIEYEVPRIIMVTPNTEGYENKYIEEGFDNIISKPIDKYKIDNLIKYFFDNKDAS